MDTNQKISLALLIGRVITVVFTLLVLPRLFRNISAINYPELKQVRIWLFIGGTIVMLGNFVPIVIDVMGVLGKGSFGLLLAYVFSNNLTALLAAIIQWVTQKTIEKTRLNE